MRRRPLGAVPNPQTEIELPVQPRDGREPPDRYQAVCDLRRRGYRVRRCGSSHLVNGRIVTTPELFQLARAARKAKPFLEDLRP